MAEDLHLTAHLLRRAGFGATEAELAEYAALGYESAVERLLNPAATDDSATDRLLAQVGSLDSEQKIVDGAALWLLRMTYSKRPLVEKMTLFWHNHFATSFGKVKPPALMYGQNRLLREHGLGKFDDLLLGVARDPAMIRWLDNDTNRKGHPNENWGRELMELFTIGIGNYSETDVREVARAFTGWAVDANGRFRFNRAQHDSGSKTILGQTGPFDGGDVVTMLAARRETGLFLARKMWRWLVNDTVDAGEANKLADVYISSGHSIGAMLRLIFLGDPFKAEANRFTTIKNPPEFIVGALKASGASGGPVAPPDAAILRRIAQSCRAMGMQLYAPPSVGGWAVGRVWISPDTYFARATFALMLVNNPAFGPLQLPSLGTDRDAAADAVLEQFLHGPAPAVLSESLHDYARQNLVAPLPGLVHLIMSSPSYQMN